MEGWFSSFLVQMVKVSENRKGLLSASCQRVRWSLEYEFCYCIHFIVKWFWCCNDIEEEENQNQNKIQILTLEKNWRIIAFCAGKMIYIDKQLLAFVNKQLWEESQRKNNHFIKIFASIKHKFIFWKIYCCVHRPLVVTLGDCNSDKC